MGANFDKLEQLTTRPAGMGDLEFIVVLTGHIRSLLVDLDTIDADFTEAADEADLCDTYDRTVADVNGRLRTAVLHGRNVPLARVTFLVRAANRNALNHLENVIDDNLGETNCHDYTWQPEAV